LILVHYLNHLFGFDYGLPYGHFAFYNMWSGFGSDVQEFAILGLVAGAYKKHQCHDKDCWRIGWYPAAEGGGWHYCKTHHKHGGLHL
jgi:hypothetical protein